MNDDQKAAFTCLQDKFGACNERKCKRKPAERDALDDLKKRGDKMNNDQKAVLTCLQDKVKTTRVYKIEWNSAKPSWRV